MEESEPARINIAQIPDSFFLEKCHNIKLLLAVFTIIWIFVTLLTLSMLEFIDCFKYINWIAAQN